MEYTKQYIDTLLQKFMDAQTSEEEEQLLADFFATAEDIPAEWEAYKDIFQSFETDAYEMNDKYLDEKFIEDEPVAEDDSMVIDTPKRVELKPKISWGRWHSIAASVVILCGLTLTMHHIHDNQQVQAADESLTLSDEEVAAFLLEASGNTFKAQGMPNLLRASNGHLGQKFLY